MKRMAGLGKHTEELSKILNLIVIFRRRTFCLNMELCWNKNQAPENYKGGADEQQETILELKDSAKRWHDRLAELLGLVITDKKVYREIESYATEQYAEYEIDMCLE